MRKNSVYFLGYLVCTCVLLMLLAEFAIRQFELAPPWPSTTGNMVADPYLPFLPRPDSTLSGRSRFDEFDYLIEINSVGFRDRDRPYSKPPGVFRILGLGDSTTYGGGALLEETYLARVERRLNERDGDHPVIDIIKAGIPRYYPEAQRMLLDQYGLRYEPDLVIVGFGSSDVIDTLIGLDAIRISADAETGSATRRKLGASGMLLYEHSHLARIFLDRMLRNASQRPVDWDELYRTGGRYEAQWQEVETEFARMAGLSKQAGANLVILYIPDYTLFDRGEERLYPPRRLRAWAEANDAYFVDPTAALLAAHEDSDEPLFWPRDKHPTPAGYAVIADVLYAGLEAHSLIP